MLNYKKKYLKYKKKYLEAKKLYVGGGRNRKPPQRYNPSDYLPIEKKKIKIAKVTKKKIQNTIQEKSHLLPWIDSSTRIFAIWTFRALKYHWKYNPDISGGDDSQSMYYSIQYWGSHIDQYIYYNKLNYKKYNKDKIIGMIQDIIIEYLEDKGIHIEDEQNRFMYFCKNELANNSQCLTNIYDLIYDDDKGNGTLEDIKLAQALAMFFSLLINTMSNLINFEEHYRSRLVVRASTFCSGKDKEGGHLPVLLNECPCCSKLKDSCIVLEDSKEQEELIGNMIQELIEKMHNDIDNESGGKDDDWEPDATPYIDLQWFEDNLNPHPFNDGSGPISFYIEQEWEEYGFEQHIDLDDIELMEDEQLDDLVNDFYGFDGCQNSESEEEDYNQGYQEDYNQEDYNQGYQEDYNQGNYEEGQGYDALAGPLQVNNTETYISDVWAAARIGK